MDVTLPDGQLLKNVPEGTSRAQIAERLRANGHDVPDSWVQQEKNPNPKPRGMLDRVHDAVEASGEPLIAGVYNTGVAGVGNLVGAAKTLTSGKYGTQEGISEGQKAMDEFIQKHSYTPRSEGARNVLETVGKVVEKTGLQGLNPAEGVMAAQALKDAPISTVASRAVQASKSAVAEKAAAAGQKFILPENRVLAQKASDLGITIRPDMLSDNKFMRMIGEAFEKVPFSGSKAEVRQIGFNRAIMGQLGVDLKSGVRRLTSDVFDKAMNKSGGVIGDVSKRTPINLAAEDPAGFDGQLSAFVDNAKKFETSDHARIAENYVNELRAKAQNGVIPGEAFRKINSQIGTRLRSTKDGDLRRVLSDLQDTMQDALERQAKPEDVAALKVARQQYAIGKTIEPLVAKTKNGDISPAGLMGAMTSDSAKKSLMARGKAGAMGDLAKIGQAFLKEPSSSNTTERALTYGLMGGAAGAGATIEPHTAAGVYGAANLYNRLGPLVTRMLLAQEKK